MSTRQFKHAKEELVARSLPCLKAAMEEPASCSETPGVRGFSLFSSWSALAILAAPGGEGMLWLFKVANSIGWKKTERGQTAVLFLLE